MTFIFDQDTMVEPIGDLLFRGRVDDGWNIGNNPNGGYLVSLVSAALAQCLEHPDPISFTTHFLRPGLPGEDCEIAVEILRQGRTVSTVRAKLSQEGKPRLEVLAAYGDLSTPVGIDSDISLPMPAVAPPEECEPRSGSLQQINIAMLDKLDVRLDMRSPTKRVVAEQRLSRKEKATGTGDDPAFSGWIRFPDDRPPDTRAMLLFCDTYPPSPFRRLGVVGWVPTIELTVHVRRRPAPGWVMANFQTDDLTEGRMIETGSLWDSGGHLVAQSRQIGVVRTPEA